MAITAQMPATPGIPVRLAMVAKTSLDLPPGRFVDVIDCPRGMLVDDAWGLWGAHRHRPGLSGLRLHRQDSVDVSVQGRER